MRSRMFLCLVLILTALSVVPAWCADVPSDGIPVYNGANVRVQVTLTEKDFLPAIRQVLGMVPGFFAAFTGRATAPAPAVANAKSGPAPSQDPQAMMESLAADLNKALEGVKKISVAVYALPVGVTGDQLTAFYAREIGLGEGWLNNVTVNDSKAMVRVYSRSNLEGIFGFVVAKNQLIAFQTTGRVDLATLTQVVGKYVPMVMKVIGAGPANPQSPTQTAPKPSEPAKK